MKTSAGKSDKIVGRYRILKVTLLLILTGVFVDMATPRFGGACDRMNGESSLLCTLQAIRSQIELYRIQHNDLLPGETCMGDAITESAFVSALTGRTDEYGYLDPQGQLGPYLQKMPFNPFADRDRGRRIMVIRSNNEPVEAKERPGWAFNEITGEFHAWDSVAHADL